MKSLLKNITLLDIGRSLSCLKGFILSLGKTQTIADLDNSNCAIFIKT